MIEDVPKFLDELCVKLGICLSPDGRAAIARTRFRDADAMELALLAAEGLDPLHADSRLRDDLRVMIMRHWRR